MDRISGQGFSGVETGFNAPSVGAPGFSYPSPYAPRPVGGPLPLEFLAALTALLGVFRQLQGGWQGFLSGPAPRQNAGFQPGFTPAPFGYGAPSGFGSYGFPVQRAPVFGQPAVSGWGWRNVNLGQIDTSFLPPAPTPSPVRVNPTPYALSPAGVGSAA